MVASDNLDCLYNQCEG